MSGLTLDSTKTIPARRKPVRPSAVVGRVLLYLLLALFAAFLLMPFYWMVVSSFKLNTAVFTAPIQWLPDPVVFQHYVDIWAVPNFLDWIRNTVILAVVVTFLQVFTGSFAAYGFAKTRFPGRDVLFLVYVGTIAVPWQSYMIPQFLMLSKAGLADTLWSIMLLQAFGAFGVFLMKQYYESIPEELSESGRLDGLSEYGIWRRIMLPLSAPALASLTLLTFVNTWNDYLGPLLYLRNRSLWTIQIGLRKLVEENFAAQYGLLFTGLVLAVIPVVAVFLAGQRYFVEGIATQGMKG